MPVHTFTFFFEHALFAKTSSSAVDVCEIAAELRRESEIHQTDYRTYRKHKVVHSHLILGQKMQYKRQCHQSSTNLENLGDITPRYILPCNLDTQIRIICKLFSSAKKLYSWTKSYKYTDLLKPGNDDNPFR